MSYALGIDLGTTFTAAAIADENASRMVGLAHDRTAIPSVVAPARKLVGEEALVVSSTAPWTVAREFKRRFGAPTPIVLEGVGHRAEDLMGHLLAWVVDRVTSMEGEAPDTITLCHPASWGQDRTELLLATAEKVGVTASLIAEPIAAAIHYHSRQRVPEGGTIAVYDLGGGTFDVTVLERTVDSYVLRGNAGGLERAGGIDLDAALFDDVIESLDDRYTEPAHDDHAGQRALATLREECVRAKIGLSYDTRVVVPIALPGIVTEVLVQRADFERSVNPIVLATIEATADVIAGAGLEPADLHSVLLVGGSSRMPLIAQRLTYALGVDIAVDSHPKHAVALGAALSATSEAPATPPASSPAVASGDNETLALPIVSAPDAAPPHPEDPAGSDTDPGLGDPSDQQHSANEAAHEPIELQDIPAPTVTVDLASLASVLTSRFIVVLTGPQGGRLIELPEGETVIGRDPANGVIGLGDRLVSRRHVSITRSGSVVRVADLGSTNGTRVDGVAIGRDEVSIEPGTVLDIANVLVMVDGAGARLETVGSVQRSWQLAFAKNGRVIDRLRNVGPGNRSSPGADDQLAMSALSDRVRRARRFEQPPAALLHAWSVVLPERIDWWRDAEAEPTVVLGYADLPSVLGEPGAGEAPRRGSSQHGDTPGADSMVPFTVPVLGWTTILSGDGPHIDAIVRSMLAEFRLRRPQTPVIDRWDPAATATGALLVVRSAHLLDTDRSALKSAMSAAAGVIWLGDVLTVPPETQTAVVAMAGDGASYSANGQTVMFAPATLGS